MSDRNLRKLIKSNNLLIEPLAADTIQQNGIDFRIGDELASGTLTSNTEIINSKSSDDIMKFYQIVKNENAAFVFSPLRHYLLTTKESIKMPSDLMGFCGLRSTFARLGFVSPLTIIDAGFEGTLTIGVFYGGNNPIRVPVGCRFLHVVFAQLADKADTPYHGHYVKQKGVTLPKALI
jgi:dCTP deaminase